AKTPAGFGPAPGGPPPALASQAASILKRNCAVSSESAMRGEGKRTEGELGVGFLAEFRNDSTRVDDWICGKSLSSVRCLYMLLPWHTCCSYEPNSLRQSPGGAEQSEC